MSATEADAEDEQTDEENYAWMAQQPDSRISGVVDGLIYAGRLDDSIAQNDTSFGVVLKQPEVVSGTLWRNAEKPEGETMEAAVDDDEPRPTDYRAVGEAQADTTEVGGETFLTTGEQGPSSYEAADGIDEDAVIVWYNGVAGGRIGRTLDFNGRPFADWTDDGGYFVKGLLQPATGWRDADGSKRSEMAQNGLAPRVARAPILRQRVEVDRDDEGDIADVRLLDEPTEQRVLIDLSKLQGGRTYEAHVFDADEFADEMGSLDAELPRNDAGYVEGVAAELDMPYSPVADAVLSQAEFAMHVHTGEGWTDEAPSDGGSGGQTESFGISADSGSGGLTAKQRQFVDEVSDELRGSGLTPDEMFDGGIEGLIGRHSSQFDQVPDADDIREAVYAEVQHLDVDTLGD